MNLRFLVFSTLDKQRRACEAEVQLNARVAPDVYLGVRPITQDAAGALTLEGSGEVVEWAVAMKRLPDVRRADLLLRRGELRDAHVDALAARLASFHAASPADEALQAFGSCDAVLGNVLENFDQTEASVREYLRAFRARRARVALGSTRRWTRASAPASTVSGPSPWLRSTARLSGWSRPVPPPSFAGRTCKSASGAPR